MADPAPSATQRYLPFLLIVAIAAGAYYYFDLEVYFEEFIKAKELQESYDFIVGKWSCEMADRPWKVKSIRGVEKNPSEAPRNDGGCAVRVEAKLPVDVLVLKSIENAPFCILFIFFRNFIRRRLRKN